MAECRPGFKPQFPGPTWPGTGGHGDCGIVRSMARGNAEGRNQQNRPRVSMRLSTASAAISRRNCPEKSAPPIDVEVIIRGIPCNGTAYAGISERSTVGGTSPHPRQKSVALIEADRDRYAALADAVRSYADIPGVFIYLLDSTFEKAMDELSASVPRFFRTPHPLLAFIDPFGVKGFTFASVSRLLASPHVGGAAELRCGRHCARAPRRPRGSP